MQLDVIAKQSQNCIAGPALTLPYLLNGRPGMEGQGVATTCLGKGCLAHLPSGDLQVTVLRTSSAWIRGHHDVPVDSLLSPEVGDQAYNIDKFSAET